MPNTASTAKSKCEMRYTNKKLNNINRCIRILSSRFFYSSTNNLKRAKHFSQHFFSYSIVYLEITSKKGKKESSRSHVVDISFNTHGTCSDVGSSFLLPLPPFLASNTRQHLVERVYIMLNTKSEHSETLGLGK